MQFCHAWRAFAPCAYRSCLPIHASYPECKEHLAKAYLVTRIEYMCAVSLQARVVHKRAIRTSQVTQHVLAIGIGNLGVAA